MESFLLQLANNESQSLVELVKNEARYLCCFNTIVKNFVKEKKTLGAKLNRVKGKFQKGKGVYIFKEEAELWVDAADEINNIDTEKKKKLFFDWCPNCWWQYRKGKKLAKETQRIGKLLTRYESNIVVGRANVLDIDLLPSQGFIHFKSRESKFQDLLEALQDENCNMIVLQGFAGTGKTSMAKEVGHKLKESKLINKVIFLDVSQLPDFKKICRKLAKGLDLNLNEVKEELLNTILSRITNMEEKLLIILDDVWEEFNLTENLGIPFRHPHKSCNLLITTRNLDVYKEMGRHMIKLEALTDEEALNLFKACASLTSSHHGFKGMPEKIVKHCKGVSIAIVAVAGALKSKPICVWKDALKTLEDRGVDQNFKEAYKCLKLSYDNLKNQNAKELLLISSLFPEDFDIPIKFLIKIGIGLGSFNENDEYHSIRNEVHGAIVELISFSLLLKGEEECVKLHDLVREVALQIGGNNIQSLWDLEKPIKENLKYLFWKNDKFPDVFDGNQLEVLSIFQDDSEGLNVTDTFFKEMTNLKVLFLFNVNGLAPSLTNSLQPLKFIQTLTLGCLELGDISGFGNLSSLMTLSFYNCSIVELPKEFLKLRKLRSLEVGSCKIEKNPFEVIEMCPQLEELTFVENVCDGDEKDAISQNRSPLRLHRYSISSRDDLSNHFQKYGSMSRCFEVDELSHLISDSTFKQLVGRAEVLSSERNDVQRMWKNLVPDIVPIEKEDVMDDLIVLHLSSHPDMECLISIKNHDPDVTAFCNLAELHLSKMGVEDLCQGPLPSGFLERLEILKLTECHKLKNILFNGNYNLCLLKSMQLKDCPKLVSVFQPYTAQSLEQLKELTITNCNALEYIIVGEDGDSNQKSYWDSLFPSLKEMGLSRLSSFIGIVREYHQPMSPSMHNPSPPVSRHNSSNLNQSLATRAFSWVQACCSLNKWRSTSIKEQHSSSHNQNDELHFDLSDLETLDIRHTPKINNIFAKNYSMVNWTATEKVYSTTNGAPPFHATQDRLKNIRKIELVGCANLKSLTTLSIAPTISLEVLTIRECAQLKCVVADEGDSITQINYNSIFPKLKVLEVSLCDALEYLFPAYAFRSPLYLEYLKINKAPMLKYVFGRSQHDGRLSHDGNHNVQTLIDFPVLKNLSIGYVPKLVSIYPKNYYMRGSYLRYVNWKELPEFAMELFNEFLVCWHTEQKKTKVIEMYWKNLVYLEVCDFKIEEIFDSTYTKTEKKGGELQPLTSSLEILKLQNLSDLICVGPKCIIRFDSLQDLTIEACKNLRVIFSASTVRSLPLLKYLSISGCEELVHIVEEDYEKNAGDHLPHEPCFPNLQEVSVSNCDKLKYLFSITIYDILPELRELYISDANKLEHLLIKRDEMEEMLMKDVLPQLTHVVLGNLPNLVSVCHGINFQKKDYFTQVYNCRKFGTLTTQHQGDPKIGNSQVEEKAEERLSSYVREETQQSLTKGATEEIVEEDFISEIAKTTISASDSKLTWPLVVKARAKGVSSNTLYQIFPTSETEVPIHTSLSLTILPTSDTTHTLAKIFEEEEEEQGDPFAPPITTVLSEQTSQVILAPSPMSSKASTNLNQAPSILSKASNDDDVQVYDESHPHSTNVFEGVDHGDIKEVGVVQNEYKFNFKPSNLTPRKQESSYSKGQIQTKDQLTDSKPRSVMPTISFVTISQDEYSEERIPMSLNSTFLSISPSTTVKIFEEEEIGDPFVLLSPMSLKVSTSLNQTPSILPKPSDETTTTFCSKNQDSEVCERTEQELSFHLNDRQAMETQPPTTSSSNFIRGIEEGIIFEKPKVRNLSSLAVTTRGHRSDIKAEISLSKEKVEIPNHDLNVQCTTPILSEQTSETILPSSAISSKASTGLDQTPQAILCKPTSDDDIQVSDKSHAAAIGYVVPIPKLITQEIVEMMKLEGSETCLLEEALKTHPQLYLSKNDRSTQMMCVSYRVLIDILNILTTRTPLTITEADKRLLEEKLKDAYFLGFDKHWLDSIKARVFNCDVYEVDGIQETLKGLESDLKTNEMMLAATRNQELEAARIVELAHKDLDAALQEHANVMANHTQLLKARQDILAWQNQCWDMITSKNAPFGF